MQSVFAKFFCKGSHFCPIFVIMPSKLIMFIIYLKTYSTPSIVPERMLPTPLFLMIAITKCFTCNNLVQRYNKNNHNARKKQKIYSTYYAYFFIALESLQAGRCHTHTIHMPYTYHTHTIPLSMATIWHHREKTEASPCITTTSYMRNGSGDDRPLIYLKGAAPSLGCCSLYMTNQKL